MNTGFNPPGLATNGINRPSANFSLPSGLSLLFGILKPVTFPGVIQQAETATPEINYSGIRVVDESSNPPISHIGTPILYPITLRGGSYRRYDRQGRIEQVNMGAMRLPMASVVEMSRAKRITKTEVMAANSSVKEIYGFEDWSIRISGIMIDEPTHPHGRTTIEAMQEEVERWFNLADSVEVEGDLFHLRGVYRMVLRSINYVQYPGKPRVHGYQLECDSDAPLELIIQ